MKNDIFKLFVYGSLRSGFRSAAYEYLAKNFNLLGEANVRGRYFEKENFPVALPTTEDLHIIGELYEIKNEAEFSWIIGQLDDYEGLNTEEGEQPLYRRALVDAHQNGTTVPAWIYWYNQSIEGMKPIETGDAIKYLQEKFKP
jgi:gamma-glutamylcyclotransferase (GGCT)/AIG2-like uncharacterized protein YtfP